jgi:hypothetical protein
VSAAKALHEDPAHHPLAAVLAELCWRPEQLARQVDAFAAGHGRSERIHPKTPYKWLGGSQPRSPRLALIPLALSEALQREVTAADLSGSPQHPQLDEQPDGTWRLLDDREASPADWIYVFDIEDQPGPDGSPAPINVRLVIGTDAATLSRRPSTSPPAC